MRTAAPLLLVVTFLCAAALALDSEDSAALAALCSVAAPRTWTVCNDTNNACSWPGVTCQGDRVASLCVIASVILRGLFVIRIPL